jgi:hypothetical protein
MADPFGIRPGNAHIDADGKQHGVPWTHRPVVPSSCELQCVACHSLKPWHLYNRKTGEGICSECYAEGRRFSEKEG